LRQVVSREVQGYNNADPQRFSTFALRAQWLDPDAERQERVVGGYGGLVDFLATRVRARGGAIHLDTEVTAVESDGRRVIARTRDSRSFTGAAAILTPPLPVLRTLAVPAPLAARIAAADAAIGLGQVVKLHLRFARRWWIVPRDGQPGFADLGFVFGAHVPVPVWWTQYPAEHAVLTGWTSAYKVEEAGRRSRDQWLALGLGSLAALFDCAPEGLVSEMITAQVTMWGDDPFARGAYSYPTLDTPAAVAALQSIDGPIHLAGEALFTGGETGTVEAALQSGREAAHTYLR
jgi:monoamine oxidase